MTPYAKFLRQCVVWCALVMSTVTLVACGSDETGPTDKDVTKLYWSLGLNYRAVTMSTKAPYNTLQLEIVPKTVDGTPLTGGTVQFRVGDGADTTVFVSPTGLLTAHAPNFGVRVVVMLTHDGLTLKDSVLVRVDTASPGSPTHPLQTFSIRPSDSDSLTIECGLGSLPATTTIIDARGNSISDIPVYYRSANPSVATVGIYPSTSGGGLDGTPFNSTIYPNCNGSQVGVPVWIYATATFYGVTYTDSVRFNSTFPTTGIYFVTEGYTADGQPTILSPTQNISIGVGGMVIWAFSPADGSNGTKKTFDLIFDKPEHVAKGVEPLELFPGLPVFGDAAGNIIGWTVDPNVQPYPAPDYLPNPKWGEVNMRFRVFPTAGRYTFRSPQYPDFTGTINVGNP